MLPFIPRQSRSYVGRCRKQVDLEAIASVFARRPSTPVVQLLQGLEAFQPRADRTEYGRQATRFAVAAIRAYEVTLASTLRDLVAASYVDGTTGWTCLRRCSVLLEQMADRRGAAAAQPEPVVIAETDSDAGEGEANTTDGEDVMTIFLLTIHINNSAELLLFDWLNYVTIETL